MDLKPQPTPLIADAIEEAIKFHATFVFANVADVVKMVMSTTNESKVTIWNALHVLWAVRILELLQVAETELPPDETSFCPFGRVEGTYFGYVRWRGEHSAGFPLETRIDKTDILAALEKMFQAGRAHEAAKRSSAKAICNGHNTRANQLQDEVCELLGLYATTEETRRDLLEFALEKSNSRRQQRNRPTGNSAICMEIMIRQASDRSGNLYEIKMGGQIVADTDCVATAIWVKNTIAAAFAYYGKLTEDSRTAVKNELRIMRLENVVGVYW